MNSADNCILQSTNSERYRGMYGPRSLFIIYVCHAASGVPVIIYWQIFVLNLHFNECQQGNRYHPGWYMCNVGDLFPWIMNQYWSSDCVLNLLRSMWYMLKMRYTVSQLEFSCDWTESLCVWLTGLGHVCWLIETKAAGNRADGGTP
jgi:hypothetical protein